MKPSGKGKDRKKSMGSGIKSLDSTSIPESRENEEERIFFKYYLSTRPPDEYIEFFPDNYQTICHLRNFGPKESYKVCQDKVRFDNDGTTFISTEEKTVKNGMRGYFESICAELEQKNEIVYFYKEALTKQK